MGFGSPIEIKEVNNQSLIVRFLGKPAKKGLGLRPRPGKGYNRQISHMGQWGPPGPVGPSNIKGPTGSDWHSKLAKQVLKLNFCEKLTF